MDDFRGSLSQSIFQCCRNVFTSYQSLRYDALLGITINDQSCLMFQVQGLVGMQTDINAAWAQSLLFVQKLKADMAKAVISDCWKYIQDVRCVKVEGMITVIIDNTQCAFIKLDHNSSKKVTQTATPGTSNTFGVGGLYNLTQAAAQADSAFPMDDDDDNFDPTNDYDPAYIPETSLSTVTTFGAIDSMNTSTSPAKKKKQVKQKKASSTKTSDTELGNFKPGTSKVPKKERRQQQVHKYERIDGKPACPVCSRTFGRPWNVTAHMMVHTGEKPFTCKDCPIKFSNVRALKKHVDRIHLKIKHNCTVCDKSYFDKHLLNDHMNEHSGNTPYVCDICNTESFTGKNLLQIHLRAEHDVRLKRCQKCRELRRDKERLMEHVATHTPRQKEPAEKNIVRKKEKKGGDYMCGECNQKCSSIEVLIEHLAGHEEEHDKISSTETAEKTEN